MSEERVSIGTFEAKLSEYLSRARAGLARRPQAALGRSALAADRPRDPEGRSLETVLEERAEGW